MRMKIRMRMRHLGWGLLAVVALSGCPKKPVVVVPGTDDGEAVSIFNRLRDSGGAVAKTDEARTELAATLGRGAGAKFSGAQPKGSESVECYAAGCTALVSYADTDVFLAFDKAAWASVPGKPAIWPGVRGRSEPYWRGQEIVARWYVLLPPETRRLPETQNVDPNIQPELKKAAAR
jgi:hypothetical protein